MGCLGFLILKNIKLREVLKSTQRMQMGNLPVKKLLTIVVIRWDPMFQGM